MDRRFPVRSILAFMILTITATHSRSQPGVVVSWGDQAIPLSFYNAKRIMSVTAGSQHNVAVKSDGMVVAWGHNYTNCSSLGLPDAGNNS